ncbi:unnamed protein product [Rodentolepis nana]|uniref:PEHE domain-containing protein n=1 Tax=Rodentolepis nana TaxID=102285 RepID=A0A0R3T9F7_RODNA|nr:unnamed protein product [Rodentolepis nana]
MPGIPPLARFDEVETDSETSSDYTSTSDWNYNSYTRDGLIRSDYDYRQLLHRRQLMAIRKLINDSESSPKDEAKGSDEGAYASSDSSESTDAYELKSFQVKGSDSCRRKLVPPPILKLENMAERRVQPLELKKEIICSVPDAEENCKRRYKKEKEKLLLRTSTQPPHNRTITTDRLVSLQPSNAIHQGEQELFH